LVKKQ